LNTNATSVSGKASELEHNREGHEFTRLASLRAETSAIAGSILPMKKPERPVAFWPEKKLTAV
jgi:hypothetical protein